MRNALLAAIVITGCASTAQMRASGSGIFAGDSPAVLTVTLPLVAAPGRLLLLTARGCGTSLVPGETEAGSAGEQPAKG